MKKVPKPKNKSVKQLEELFAEASIVIYLSGNPQATSIYYDKLGDAEDQFDALYSWRDRADGKPFLLKSPALTMMIDSYHTLQAATLVVTKVNAQLITSSQRHINKLMQQPE